MSGTGKSELANCYSEALGCTEDLNTLLFLPINPSYTEPGDLIGYLNNTNGLFMPSETRLVDFLVNAKNNPKSMHIVVFDEMNLSQVEYWFAPFISLLERKEGDRTLNLYSPEINCINKHAYPSFISIRDNVKFIGTVNLDETTKDFSDRLLDRTNIITITKRSLKTLKEAMDNFTPKGEKLKISHSNSFETFIPWVVRNSWVDSYYELEREFLDELHTMLNKYDSQKGVSFRISKKIGEYLMNIPRDLDNNYMLSRKDAFDLQIKQRIITKIKGTEKQFGDLVGVIKNKEQNVPIGGELYGFLNMDKWKDISDFNLTNEEITKKAKELGVYGYTN
jgi:5-methylcytosine-specific restriction endonuclease McrBC GTP-binding regulatory subunit McrB